MTEEKPEMKMIAIEMMNTFGKYNLSINDCLKIMVEVSAALLMTSPQVVEINEHMFTEALSRSIAHYMEKYRELKENL